MPDKTLTRTLAAGALSLSLLVTTAGVAAASTYDFIPSAFPMGTAQIFVDTSGATWPEGTLFTVDSHEVVPGQLELTVHDFYLPVVKGTFGERFEFQLLDASLNPTTTLHLYAFVGPSGSWSVNPWPAQHSVNIEVRQKNASGAITRTDVVALPFTTSTASSGPCDATPSGIELDGVSMDPATGGMALVGTKCVGDYPLILNLEGVMAAPEPTAGGLALAAIGVVGMLRRRAG